MQVSISPAACSDEQAEREFLGGAVASRTGIEALAER